MRWAAGSLIRLYQLIFSPALHLLFSAGLGCRFTPSCSEYAQTAIQEHGAWRGGWLAAKRLARCNPFSRGGFDPVPRRNSANPML